jgi:tetratricopeptide (TPR) repeat protein
MHLAGRMAEVLIESDRAKEALEILAPFAGRPEQPLPGAIFRILGKAYQALNQWKKAKTSWQQAIKKNHEDSESMALLALGYLEEINDRETASKLKRQAEVLGNRTKQTRTILERLNRKLNPLDLQK